MPVVWEAQLHPVSRHRERLAAVRAALVVTDRLALIPAAAVRLVQVALVVLEAMDIRHLTAVLAAAAVVTMVRLAPRELQPLVVPVVLAVEHRAGLAVQGQRQPLLRLHPVKSVRVAEAAAGQKMAAQLLAWVLGWVATEIFGLLQLLLPLLLL
jgi:hypothetical protein